MSRPSKQDCWRPTESLRIRVWYQGLLQVTLGDNSKRNAKGELRSADLQRYLADRGVELTSGRLSDWKNGRCLPSRGKLRALANISPDLAACESVLRPSSAVSEDRIENLLHVLDVVASENEVRRDCVDLIRELARPWLPEAIVQGQAAFGWRSAKLGNIEIPPAIAHAVNPLDPISMLHGCFLLASTFLGPRLVDHMARRSDERSDCTNFCTDWALDTLCICLLVTRLVMRELSRGDGDRIHAAAGGAVVVRQVLLGEMNVRQPEHLAAKLRLVDAPSSEEFVFLLLQCRELLTMRIQNHHVGINDLLRVARKAM